MSARARIGSAASTTVGLGLVVTALGLAVTFARGDTVGAAAPMAARGYAVSAEGARVTVESRSPDERRER